MSVSCFLRIGDHQEPLDRHYVFDEVFEDGKEYTKKEALKLLTLIEPFGREDYFEYWINYVKEKLKDYDDDTKITILSENYMWDM